VAKPSDLHALRTSGAAPIVLAAGGRSIGGSAYDHGGVGELSLPDGRLVMLSVLSLSEA
jgi:hypothetical protein